MSGELLTELIDSARELRNPLLIGYSIILTAWLWWGDIIPDASEDSQLLGRIVEGLEGLGSAVILALLTFAAAVIGSFAWNIGLHRLVIFLQSKLDHPDWEAYIEEARQAVVAHESYSVQGPLSSSGHSVPSQYKSTLLQAKVDERVRTQSEIVFRVTLALALVPVAASVVLIGNSRWWLISCLAVAVVWIDVLMIKFSSATKIGLYELEDLASELARSQPSEYSEPGEYEDNKKVRAKVLEQGIRKKHAEVQALSPKLGWLQGKKRVPALEQFLGDDVANGKPTDEKVQSDDEG